jgi:hypothetical protein
MKPLLRLACEEVMIHSSALTHWQHRFWQHQIPLYLMSVMDYQQAYFTYLQRHLR